MLDHIGIQELLLENSVALESILTHIIYFLMGYINEGIIVTILIITSPSLFIFSSGQDTDNRGDKNSL